MDNAFFKFLAEFITRLFSDKPKFFVIIQWIAFLTGGISAAILYLQTVITLPSWVTALGSANVIIAAVVAIILSQLPNKAK